MRDLAHQVVKDGEGATKFVEDSVTGARDADATRAMALAIANSPLVKTAIAGEDPNWGRIVMAVGKSGERPTATGWRSASATSWWPRTAGSRRATPRQTARPT
jgi:N-acetylglutamate synthase/N-acetylornithine aminotransferase